MRYLTQILITLLLLALLAACRSTETANPVLDGVAEAPIDGTEDSTADPAMDATASDTLCEEGLRFFDHELLASEPTCIPEQPEQVVSAAPPSYLYSFGVNPVASWGLESDAENYPFIADWIREGTVDHGIPPNLEIVVEQNPDLIYSSAVIATDVEEELSEIAPLVILESDPSDPPTWQEIHLFAGAVFNQSKQAEEQIGVYDQRVAELRTALEENGSAPSDITISVVRLASEDNIGLLSPIITSVAIIKDVGFAIPDAVDMSVEEMQETNNISFGILNLSKEEIALADGDVLFVLGAPGGGQAQNSEDNQIISGMMNDPLWQSLRAFETDDVYGKGEVWIQSNILSAHLILDDLAEIFEVEIATPNPFLVDETSAESSDVVTTYTCDDGFRSIDSAFGPTCIPVTPERIIALNESVMTNLLALGVTPIGVMDFANRDGSNYLGDTTEEIASVGAPDGPNFEAMLALEPDLILGTPDLIDEETLETLQQIAPTAISSAPNRDWRSNFLYVGEAIGKLGEAEALAERSDTRLAEFRTAYADQASADETIAIIRSRADRFDIYFRDAFIVELTTEAGLQMPTDFDQLEERGGLSLESIDLLTNDKLFVMIRNEREIGALRDLSTSPLWQTVPAVQNDEVHLVNWSVWVAGSNIVGANLVIDDLFFYMLGEEPPTPNPFSDLIIDDFGPQYDDARLTLE